MRGDYARLVADLVHDLGRQHVDDQLRDKVDRDKHRDLVQPDRKFRLKCQKQQGRKVVDDRLSDVSDKTRRKRVLVGQFCHSFTAVILL